MSVPHTHANQKHFYYNYGNTTIVRSNSTTIVRMVVPISMDFWSRAWICDRSLSVIAGLIPAEGNLVFVVSCVGSGLCDELIFRPEDSCRLCVCVCVCLIVCDSESYKKTACPIWVTAPRCYCYQELELFKLGTSFGTTTLSHTSYISKAVALKTHEKRGSLCVEIEGQTATSIYNALGVAWENHQQWVDKKSVWT